MLSGEQSKLQYCHKYYIGASLYVSEKNNFCIGIIFHDITSKEEFGEFVSAELLQVTREKEDFDQETPFSNLFILTIPGEKGYVFERFSFSLTQRNKSFSIWAKSITPNTNVKKVWEEFIKIFNKVADVHSAYGKDLDKIEEEVKEALLVPVCLKYLDVVTNFTRYTPQSFSEMDSFLNDSIRQIKRNRQKIRKTK